ncbi:MAG: hypothetical protein ACJASL_004620 [Paraglaciecola sp.]|jgi:hypothetical protein
MNRGLGGVLTLPSRGLASGAAAAPIFYRFISAHWMSCLLLAVLFILALSEGCCGMAGTFCFEEGH